MVKKQLLIFMLTLFSSACHPGAKEKIAELEAKIDKLENGYDRSSITTINGKRYFVYPIHESVPYSYVFGLNLLYSDAQMDADCDCDWSTERPRHNGPRNTLWWRQLNFIEKLKSRAFYNEKIVQDSVLGSFIEAWMIDVSFEPSFCCRIDERKAGNIVLYLEEYHALPVDYPVDGAARVNEYPKGLMVTSEGTKLSMYIYEEIPVEITDNN